MWFEFIVSFLILFVNLPALAVDKQDLASLVSEPGWTKLFHSNQIKQDLFYASGDSRSSALVEVTANVDRLLTDPHYPCEFPARAHFLGSRLRIAFKECPAVVAWKKSVTGDTVSLVYVSQYVSNPASAFGHTFLLFKKGDQPLNLNSVLSNAAHLPDDVTDFDYIVKGLLGGFPAEFNTDSFYVKLQDYSHIENRDMWIYDLRFSPEQIDQLLNHVWELSHRSTTAYMFLNKNCAAYTYNALAAVHPDLDLISPHVYLLPVETIQRVAPITTQVAYWPSLREQMHLRVNQLNQDERKELKRSLQAQAQLPKTQDPTVAEIVLEDFEFLKTRQAGLLTEEQKRLYQQALINRAELGTQTTTFETVKPPPPHTSLRPRRLSMFGGTEGRETDYGFSFAPFYHSLLERTAGYLPFAEFVILDTSFRRRSEKSLIDVALFRAANFPSVTIFDSPWSWRVSTELFSEISGATKCAPCLDGGGELSLGKTWELNLENRLFGLAGIFRDRHVQLAPQILVGGFMDTSIGNALYEFRALEALNEPKTIVRWEAGFNFALGLQSQMEILASVDADSPNVEVSVDWHF